MYNTSNNYKTYINSSLSRTPKSKIVIDDVEYLDNVIMSCPSISHDNETFIGGFPSKTCTFEIKDESGTLSLKDKWIKVYRGLYIGSATEWIPMGTFRAISDEDITTNKSKKTITFKGYDKRQLLDTPYTTSLDWSTSHTGLEIVQEACNNCGLELASTAFNFATYTFTQKPNFPSDITNTEVISRMAEIGGEIALITREEKVYIKGPTAANVTIPKAKRGALIKEDAFGPITMLVLGNEGYDDDVIHKDENLINKSTTKNIIDLTKLSYSSTSSLINIDEIQSNTLKVTIKPDITSWSRLMFSLDDLLEDGEIYTIAAIADESSDILPDGTYGTIGLNRTPREGTQEQTDKTEIFMSTANYTYSRTTTWAIDKENYTYSLVFFPSRDQTITEDLTLVYKNLYIAKETSFSSYIDYKETGIKEWSIEDNPYVELIRESIIEDIAPFIIGRSIIPFAINEVVDDFFLDINDVITIVDNEGNTFTSTILSYSTSSRIKSTITAPPQKTTLSNYGIAGGTKKTLNQIKLEVNNNTNQINSLVQTTQDLTTKTSEVIQNAEEHTTSFYEEVIKEQIDDLTGALNQEIETRSAGMRTSMDEDGNMVIELGATSSIFTLELKNDGLYIYENGELLQIFANGFSDAPNMKTQNLEITPFAFKKRVNGNVSLLRVGGD